MEQPSARSRALRDRLLAWYAATGRSLPWRRTSEPYPVLVSELMLQQTQAARVEEAWPAFLERFPTVGALAAAPTAEVIGAWRGLGYNRRALNLQRAAQAVVERHGGVIPADVEALEALPGIGPYTARAVAAFAFGQRQAPVDTNVGRVLARAVAGRPLGRADAQRLADSMAPEGPAGSARDPASWSHALMDLGARRCTARSPRCEHCPVAGHCAWRAAGHPDPDPAAASAARPRPQGRFEGSDRYHRGRLVDALRERDVPSGELPRAADLPGDPSRLEGLVAALVRDGLAEWRRGSLSLPRGGA